jgi:hypothetical protein
MLTGPAIDARDVVLDSSKQIEQVVTKLDSSEGSDLFFLLTFAIGTMLYVKNIHTTQRRR